MNGTCTRRPLVAYADDTAAWATQQADFLRTARFGDLDITNLAEEIESLAKRDRHEIVSRLILLQAHLLKQQYQPEVASKSWRNTIREQARQIERTLRGSPSCGAKYPTSSSKPTPMHAPKPATRRTYRS